MLCTLFNSACTVGGSDKSLSQQNDELRARLLDLTNQLDAAQQQSNELRRQIEALAAATQSAGAPSSAELIQATPRVTVLTIGDKSHAVDEDRDGIADHLNLYIHAEDGLGRFIQLVGDLSILAALLDQQSGASTIGQVQLTPMQVRDAYRSSFTGTHYTISVPITLPATAAHSRATAARWSATVRAVFRDGTTGAELAAERPIGLAVTPPVQPRDSRPSITPTTP